MKSWDQYRISEHFHRPSLSAIRKELQASLDEQPLTKAARAAAEEALKVQAKERYDKEMKPYREEEQRLIEMFWTDVREEMGYNEAMLNPAQVSLLEARAWEKGHSGGLSDVYCQLEDLVEFVTELFERGGKSGS
jgi:hypothetical protein